MAGYLYPPRRVCRLQRSVPLVQRTAADPLLPLPGAYKRLGYPSFGSTFLSCCCTCPPHKGRRRKKLLPEGCCKRCHRRGPSTYPEGKEPPLPAGVAVPTTVRTWPPGSRGHGRIELPLRYRRHTATCHPWPSHSVVRRKRPRTQRPTSGRGRPIHNILPSVTGIDSDRCLVETHSPDLRFPPWQCTNTRCGCKDPRDLPGLDGEDWWGEAAPARSAAFRTGNGLNRLFLQIDLPNGMILGISYVQRRPL